MKNIQNKVIKEGIFTGKIVYDKNPDNPMYYFEFKIENKTVFISYNILVDSLYFGISEKQIPECLFEWLVKNSKIR